MKNFQFIYRQSSIHSLWKYIGVWCFLCISMSVSAQTFPVQVNTTIIPPYSLSLDDYASPSFDRFQTSVFVADLNANNYPVKLRLVIKGEGGLELRTKVGREFGPVFLNGGSTEFITGFTLRDLFNPDNLDFAGLSKTEYAKQAALPEGIYQFHIEVVDFNLGITVSNPNAGNFVAWLMRNDPPFINFPANNSTIEPLEPQNILFQWTPRHLGSPNSAFSTEYEITMVEVYPVTRNVYDAINTSIPVFQTTTTMTAYNYNIIDPYLVPGKRYAFRVRAYDTENRDLFKNQGYSEVFSFYYGKECDNPTTLNITAISEPGTVHLSWNKTYNQQAFDIRVKPAGQPVSWQMYSTTNTQLQIGGLEPNRAYEFRIRTACDANIASWSKSSYYRMPADDGKAKACVAPSFIKITERKDDYFVEWEPIQGVSHYEFSFAAKSDARYATLTTKEPHITTELITIADERALRELNSKRGRDKRRNETFEPTTEFLYYVTTVCLDGSRHRSRVYPYTKGKGPNFAGVCGVPDFTGFKVEQQGNKAKATWTKYPAYISYRFNYRKKGTTKWESHTLEEPQFWFNEIEEGITYEYTIDYFCSEGESNTSKMASFIIGDEIEGGNLSQTGDCFAPTNLLYEVTKEGVLTLKWDKVDGATDYKVTYRSTNFSWKSAETNGKNKFVLALALSEKDYEIKVQSKCKSNGWSEYSSSLKINPNESTAPLADCGEVTNLEGKALDDDRIQLWWTPAVAGQRFLITYQPEGVNYWLTILTSDTIETIDRLSVNTEVTFKVTAICGIEKSDATKPITIKTLSLREVSSLECGQTLENLGITNTTPLQKLKKGDEVILAQYKMKIHSLANGSSPYNGEARAYMTFYKKMYVRVKLEDAVFNTDKVLIDGRGVVIGTVIPLIDPEKAEKIKNLIGDVSNALEKTSTALAYADSLQTEINSLAENFKEPIIDTGIYANMTPKELFEEGKRIFKEVEALVADGFPTDPLTILRKTNLAIALIKKAASLGYSTVQTLSDLGKQIKDLVKETLEEVRDKADSVFTVQVEAAAKKEQKVVQASEKVNEIEGVNTTDYKRKFQSVEWNTSFSLTNEQKEAIKNYDDLQEYIQKQHDVLESYLHMKKLFMYGEHALSKLKEKNLVAFIEKVGGVIKETYNDIIADLLKGKISDETRLKVKNAVLFILMLNE